MDIFYFISSFLLTVSLIDWLLLQLKRKTSLSFHIKIFYYNTAGKFLLFGCFCYNLYLLYMEKINWLDLLPGLISSVIFILLKQNHGYSVFEINSCLDESKSIGAFWAHQTFEVYYKVFLEDIKDRMNVFEKENNIKINFKKFFIVIPLSCNTGGTFTDRDDAIKEFNYLSVVENDVAASVNRTYENCVYCISGDTYVVAEFSSPMSTLWRCRFEMDKEKLIYIRDCYIKTLKILVEGSPAVVLEYDDTGNCPKSLSNCILSSMKENS